MQGGTWCWSSHMACPRSSTMECPSLVPSSLRTLSRMQGPSLSRRCDSNQQILKFGDQIQLWPRSPQNDMGTAMDLPMKPFFKPFFWLSCFGSRKQKKCTVPLAHCQIMTMIHWSTWAGGPSCMAGEGPYPVKPDRQNACLFVKLP